MKSLRTRLLVLFGASTAFMLTVLAAVIVIQVNRTFVPFAESSGMAVAEARSAEIGRLIAAYLSELGAHADRDEFMSGDVQKVKRYFERKKIGMNSDYDYLVYSDIDGNAIRTNMGDAGISGRDYYKAVIKDGKDMFVSMPLVSTANNKQMFVVARSVKRDGETVGLIGASIDLETLSKVSSSIKIGTGGYGWIVDGTGLVIAHPNPDLLMKLNVTKSNEAGFKGLEEAGALMVKGKSGTLRYTRPDGMRAALMFCPIPNTQNWSLGVTIPEEELLSQGYSLLRIITVIAAVILVLLIMIIVLISGYITHPLTTASEHLALIGTGDFTKDVNSEAV
ncbi:MAG TPA: cache domain-containing protein, partial [Spirochaetota bacterium]|nr:cache domain-containing protein [Spirochaetota bacterium]